MSVTVRHLNADSSFLLIFSHETHPTPSDLRSENGAFSILIDPWLVGSSIVSAPWFAITHRVIPSHIQHLSEIEEPDVVLVSQNKPDHCHKVTLLQLRPEGKTLIAAEPGAARAIKKWNHFDPHRVHGLKRYDPDQRFGNSLRLRIPPLSPNGHAGEVNIAFIPARNYTTGLHNAFGITYQAPTHIRTHFTVPTVDLPKKAKYFHMPMSPVSLPPPSPPMPLSPDERASSFDIGNRNSATNQRPHTSHESKHRPHLSRASKTASSEFLSYLHRPSVDGRQPSDPDSQSSLSPNHNIPFTFNTDSIPTLDLTQHHTTIPTPPDSPILPASPSSIFTSVATASSYTYRPTSSLQTPSTSAMAPPPDSPITPPRPKPLSIIYSPHGLPLTDLQPYIQTHLVTRLSALPLTLLLHAFDHVQNPWFLGGNIMTGSPGGIAIAQALMARVWVSAHDEPKDDRGLAVAKTKTRRGQAEEVRRMLWEGGQGEGFRKSGWVCDVRSLGVGKEVCVSGSARDLWGGSRGEDGRESRLLRVGVGIAM